MSSLMLHEGIVATLINRFLSSGFSSLGSEVDSLKNCKTVSDVADWAESNSVSGEFIRHLAEAVSLPWVDQILDLKPSGQFIESFPIGLARERVVMGFESDRGQMRIALGNHDSISQLDVLSRFFDCPLDPFFAPSQQIVAAINQSYERRNSQTVETIDSLDTKEALLSLNQADR